MMNILQTRTARPSRNVTMCAHCLKPYTLGVNGTVEGCDVCLNIVRNKLDGTIISTEWDAMIDPDDDTNEEDDTLTDMEKS